MPVIQYHSISLLAKARKLTLSILNLSRGTSSALLALACWKPSATLLVANHTLLWKYICSLEKSQLSQLLPGVMWAEILLVSLQHSYGSAGWGVGSWIYWMQHEPVLYLFVAQLELSAVAELLLHIGGVSMIKIELCRSGRFVVQYVTSCIQTDTEKSYAIYFIAWEGKEHLSSALKCPVTAQGWLVCKEQV